jgi:hypothetical protein
MPPKPNSNPSAVRDKRGASGAEETEYNALVLAKTTVRTQSDDRKDADQARKAMVEQFDVAVASQSKGRELKAGLYAVGEAKAAFDLSQSYKELLDLKHSHSARQILHQVCF